MEHLTPHQEMIKQRRIGRFRLCLNDVKDNPDGVLSLMGQTIVVECQPHFDSGCFTYTAYSEHFEPVEVGACAPEYTPLIRPSGKFRGFVRMGGRGGWGVMPTESKPSAIELYRAGVIASALQLYAKHKIQVNSAYTPKAMLSTASSITGKPFKRGQYEEAAQALKEWQARWR